MDDLTRNIIKWSIWAILMTIVIKWVNRDRTKTRPSSEISTLAHPRSTLIIAIVGFIFFAGLAIISNTIGKNDTTNIWTTLVFVFFAIASVAIMFDYFNAMHTLSDSGMDVGRMFGARNTFQWHEVKYVKYASTMNWFVLELDSGKKLRISAMLMGLPEFARMLLIHVQKSVIDSGTYLILLETEQGRPPNIWGK